MSNLIAETRYGKVQGYEQGSISVWKGIPFAQPPTGSRRFRAPQPPQPWMGVRETTTFSPMAPQVQEMGASMVGAIGAEPCLLLEHKGDEPFRAPHILLIALAQMLLEDAFFYMDTVAEAKQRTAHHDKQTQPVVRQAESKSEQRDEEAGIGRMPNESVGAGFDHGLLSGDGHHRRKEGAEDDDGVET